MALSSSAPKHCLPVCSGRSVARPMCRLASLLISAHRFPPDYFQNTNEIKLNYGRVLSENEVTFYTNYAAYVSIVHYSIKI